MDFSLTPDQIFIKDTLHKFMVRECPREKVHEFDEEGSFPAELLAKIAAIGFCSLNVPEAYDGGGQNMLGATLAVEEIAALSPALAALYASVTFRGGQVISWLGSEAQKRNLLPMIAAGELRFGFALEDEQRGDMIIAAPQPAGFNLEGHALSVPLAGRADYLLVQARISQEIGDTTIFVVPADAPGVQIHLTTTVGNRGLGFGEIFFESVIVTEEDILGGPAQVNQGQKQAAYLMAVDRLATSAIGIGLAQGAYAYTASYAEQRSQFGQAIIQFEAIQHMLVDLSIGIQSTRWLLYHACWLVDQGKPFALEAAISCLQAGELARTAGLQSVHILGGYGYMVEYDAQRYMRDAMVLATGGETAECLKNTIGKLSGLGQRL